MKRFLISLFIAVAAIGWAIHQLGGASSSGGRRVRVMSYSAFTASWGPGPEIAKRFRERTGVAVDFQNAGDAGLILKKMELFPADVAIGFDVLSLGEARAARAWREVTLPSDLRFRDGPFMPFDWAPMAFVSRVGEIVPPKSLADLLESRFSGAIALEDPRTSAPGLQFFFWVLDEMGVEPGFTYLARLRPNVQSVSASWSSAYGLFVKGQAKLAFSYLTSPVYHRVEEHDDRYRAAVFEGGAPAQIEYAAIPQTCENCADAERFLLFLLEPETQRLIMEKNFMLPIRGEIAGTAFADVPPTSVRQWKHLPELLAHRDELFNRWRELGL